MHATFYFTIFYYSAAIKATSKVLPHKPICQIYILCLLPFLLYNSLFVLPLMLPDPAYRNNSSIKIFRWCPYSCSNSQKLICIRSIFILSVASSILMTQPFFPATSFDRSCNLPPEMPPLHLIDRSCFATKIATIIHLIGRSHKLPPEVSLF